MTQDAVRQQSDPQRAEQEPTDLQVDTSAHTDETPGGGAQLADSGRTRRLLVRLLQVAYPHERFPAGPYERTAAAIVDAARADAADGRAITRGLAGLDRAAGGDFLALDDAAAETLLRDRADEYFFRRIRSTAVVALYDSADVWELLGYEGPSFDRGGYLHRGFDDLDWLPGARVDEYAGEPRVELVESEEAAR
ncbi:MAG: Tat (Twin-arginine translocation) pathway signal sequence domain protein [Modestobacter sp.]|nr:Tat (Twin-arginine translocation) pathway signal sequence domain protein [Modestobacter sp.]